MSGFSQLFDAFLKFMGLIYCSQSRFLPKFYLVKTTMLGWTNSNLFQNNSLHQRPPILISGMLGSSLGFQGSQNAQKGIFTYKDVFPIYQVLIYGGPDRYMKDMSRLNWMPTSAVKINTVQNITDRWIAHSSFSK